MEGKTRLSLKPKSPKVCFWEAREATKTTKVHLRSWEQIRSSMEIVGSSIVALLVALQKNVENLLSEGEVYAVCSHRPLLVSTGAYLCVTAVPAGK